MHRLLVGNSSVARRQICGGPHRIAAGCSPPRPGRRCRARVPLAPSAAAGGQQQQQPDPHAVLGVPRGSSRRQIRQQYIDRIKLLHPDVSASLGEDTTAEAARLNAAYEALMEGFASNSRDEEEDEESNPFDVFDLPEAPPDRLFVNPFACYGVSPLQWEALQEAAGEAEAAGRDPWLALQQAGVQCSEGAFVYLSPRQLELVGEELGRACAAMDATSLEVAAYVLTDCLMRARVANNRMPSRSGS